MPIQSKSLYIVLLACLFQCTVQYSSIDARFYYSSTDVLNNNFYVGQAVNLYYTSNSASVEWQEQTNTCIFSDSATTSTGNIAGASVSVTCP